MTKWVILAATARAAGVVTEPSPAIERQAPPGPFRSRGAEHFANQAFGQAPWLTDGGMSIFESGAILLHLAEHGEALMPSDPRGRSETIELVCVQGLR
jgi:glutathione S-transferase